MWRSVASRWSLDVYAGYPHFQEVMVAMAPALFCLSSEAMCAAFAAFPDVDITPWLARISAPTLVVVGERDPTVPPEEGRLIADHVPGAELLICPGAGHMPHFEQPDLFRRGLADFLARSA